MNWAAIFDMDGVLVDSSAAHYEAWRRLGEREGRPFSPELFRQTFGMHNGQILPLWLGSDAEPAEMDRMAAWKEATYRELAADLMEPIPGVLQLIERLHDAGVPMAVGSSGPLANIQLILRTLGVENRFQALSTGEDVLHGKPDPEVFLVAARRLGMPPQRCVVLEDAPQGIEAARRAGMAVLAVSSSRPPAELAADRVVSSFEELQPAELQALLPPA
jgi:beta-phosphoglucomutase